MLELPEDTAQAIRALDEHWDGSGQPFGLRGEQIPLFGRILCLAQTVEVFVRTTGLRGALGMALKRRGRWFDPALVDALLAIRDDRAFWGPLEDSALRPAGGGVGAGRPRADRRRRPARPRRRRVLARDRRQVAVHRPPLRRGRPLGGRDRVGAGDGGGRSCATSTAPGSCTTSASSRSPAASSTSRGGWSRRSSPRSASTRATRSRSSSASRACAASSRPRPRTTRSSTAPATTVAWAPLDLSRPARILAVADIYEALDGRPAVPRGDAAREGAGDRARAAWDRRCARAPSMRWRLPPTAGSPTWLRLRGPLPCPGQLRLGRAAEKWTVPAVPGAFCTSVGAEGASVPARRPIPPPSMPQLGGG